MFPRPLAPMALLAIACSSPTVPGVGAPATLEVVSGANQSWLAGMILPDTIVVRVVDADGQPVPGVEIAASVTSLGAMIDPTLATTSDEMGEARVRWRLGIGVGPQLLRVAAPKVGGVSSVDVESTALGADVVSVVGSGDYTLCATYRDGRVGCWDQALPGGAAPLPVMAPGTLRFTELAGSSVASTMALCAPATSGRVWCTDYHLGSKTFMPWREIAGGYASLSSLAGEYTGGGSGWRFCGLDPDGVAWCWGANADGGLGDGTTDSRPDARPVTAPTRFTSISVSRYHTCGLDGAGAAWCWGRNAAGQLGRPASPDPQMVPMPVLTSLRFSKILATLEPGTCGIALGGSLYCWGSRRQLGRSLPPSSGPSYSDMPLEVTGLGSIGMLIRSTFNTFVFGPSGSGHWWGNSPEGYESLTPRPTSGPIPFTEFTSKGEGFVGCGRSSTSGPGVSCVRYGFLGWFEVQPPGALGPRFYTFLGTGVPEAPSSSPAPIQ